MSEPDLDLLVIGAGPAGAAAALGALRSDPGLRVLLLDRAAFPRDKACGDGIAPHVVDALAAVGVHDVTDGWTPLHHLELAHGSAEVTGRLRRPVWVIPREVFDARLVAHAVAAGATLERHRVRRVQVDQNAVVVDGIKARAVVAADGAESTVGRQVGARRGRRAVALRGYAPTPPGRRGRQVIRYGEARRPSYAWAFDRGDGMSNVGYGEFRLRAGEPPSRRLLLDQLECLLPGSTSGGHAWRAHHLPLSSWRVPRSSGRVLLAGDAAHLVNPMTGEGIYYAVATGLSAGRAVAAGLAAGRPDTCGTRYDVAIRRLLGAHLKHTATAAALTRSPQVLDAGIRAARRDSRVFDAFVELGLGDGRITSRVVGALGHALVLDLGRS